ncbi:hypothetical protein FZL95_07300 [Campylobacter jejuni]|nr:hypothetical protein [Campylobacter coli]ECL3075562.1 hypothetical protein [Campylobacter jejuni]ECK7755060.1 hypothetical protein [Campylobacter coli]ECL2889705.1 hypothetical protein [Campylobacter coli]ECO4019392.1 hypothetical protein [Campylobacter coli]
MFLDMISKIFIFVAIHAMIIFIIKSHIAVIKTSLKYFDFRFIITYNSIFIIAECFAFFAYSKYILN